MHCPGPPEQLHLDGHHHGSSGEAVDIGLPADTLVCDLDGFTLQPSAEAQSMGNISWNWEPSLLLLDAQTATPVAHRRGSVVLRRRPPPPRDCTYEDSIFVTATVSSVELGPDQELCEDETVTLDSGLDAAIEDITWSTGDSVAAITVDSSVSTGSRPSAHRDARGRTPFRWTSRIRCSRWRPGLRPASGSRWTSWPRWTRTRPWPALDGLGAGTTITVTEPGLYEAIAVDVTGCSGTATISPEFLPSPVPDLQPDTTLCLEDEGPIWVDVSQPGVAYLWSTGADQPGALLSEPGVYSVTLTLLANGCQDSASIELIDFCLQDSVYFPAFTPDGDWSATVRWLRRRHWKL